MTDQPRLLTRAQLCDELQISERTARTNTRAGYYPFAIDLNAATPGKKPAWRYDRRGLEKWLTANSAA